MLRTEHPAVVPGDPELVCRAVENALRNVIRHAPGQSPVEINLERVDGTARIAVRDHGPGVRDDQLEDMFRPCFRAENDRNRASGGIGLGLAIARRAVELHQGTIAAANAHPGLVITIELPLASADLPSDAKSLRMAGR